MAPYLAGVKAAPERWPAEEGYPFNLPFARDALPILLTFPGADLVSFNGGALERVALEDTSQYQITRGILQSPESYWKHLRTTGDPKP